MIGRKKKSSPGLSDYPFPYVRFNLWSEKGFLFYAVFNFRLFWFLLFKRPALLVANDLDTLLPNFLISGIKKIPLLYDSHECYTETPELQHRPMVRGFWEFLEKRMIQRVQMKVTVSQAIADYYTSKYGVEFSVVRNVPMYAPPSIPADPSAYGLPRDNPILLYQGAGINPGRGVEELILSIKLIPNVIGVIVGAGDAWQELVSLVKRDNMEKRVFFIPRVSPKELKSITAMATLGFSLDNPENLNYRFAFPNKLSDYLAQGVPVIVSKTIEAEKLVKKYECGIVLKEIHPTEISNLVIELLNRPTLMKTMRENALKAATEMTWEQDEKALFGLLQKTNS